MKNDKDYFIEINICITWPWVLLLWTRHSSMLIIQSLIIAKWWHILVMNCNSRTAILAVYATKRGNPQVNPSIINSIKPRTQLFFSLLLKRNANTNEWSDTMLQTGQYVMLSAELLVCLANRKVSTVTNTSLQLSSISPLLLYSNYLFLYLYIHQFRYLW